VSRLAGLALLVPAWLWVRTLWNASPGRAATLWRMAAAWFALSSLTLASVAVLGSQALIAGGRQAVVVLLHALLVGIVTGSLAVVGRHNRPGTAIRYHHGALAAMLAGLLGAQLGAVQPGMWVAAGGSVVLWCAGFVWVMTIIRLAEQVSGPLPRARWHDACSRSTPQISFADRSALQPDGWGSANVSRATAVWRAYGGSWTNTRLEVRRSDRSASCRWLVIPLMEAATSISLVRVRGGRGAGLDRGVDCRVADSATPYEATAWPVLWWRH
jgi:hypothetical protein